MYRFLVKKNYLELLIGLKFKQSNIKECSVISNMNEGHLRIVFDQWSKEKIISRNQVKTSSFSRPGDVIALTKKGEEIVDCLFELKKVIETEEVEESVERE